MKQEQDLNEWYAQLVNPNGGEEQDSFAQQEFPSIQTVDLNVAPPESPQDIIQREIANRSQPAQLTTTSDEVIAQDKMRIYRSLGVLQVIGAKLTKLSTMISPYEKDAIEREGLVSDIKKLVSDLADSVGSL
jgi:hypothetical protein